MNLGFKERSAYALGAVGKDMAYMLASGYVLYYYQDVLGVWVHRKKYILTDAKMKEITDQNQ